MRQRPERERAASPFVTGDPTFFPIAAVAAYFIGRMIETLVLAYFVSTKNDFLYRYGICDNTVGTSLTGNMLITPGFLILIFVIYLLFRKTSGLTMYNAAVFASLGVFLATIKAYGYSKGKLWGLLKSKERLLEAGGFVKKFETGEKKIDLVFYAEAVKQNGITFYKVVFFLTAADILFSLGLFAYVVYLIYQKIKKLVTKEHYD